MVKKATFVSFFKTRLNPIVWSKRWWGMKGFKKWFLLIIILVVVFVLTSQIQKTINRGKPNLAKFQITTVTKQDMEKVITKEGILRYSGVVDYPTPSSGIVIDVWAKNGDEVQKGQNILQLQSTATPQE